jgi:hypothetical protein
MHGGSHYKLAIFAANLVRLISSDVCERVDELWTLHECLDEG